MKKKLDGNRFYYYLKELSIVFRLVEEIYLLQLFFVDVVLLIEFE